MSGISRGSDGAEKSNVGRDPADDGEMLRGFGSWGDGTPELNPGVELVDGCPDVKPRPS
jgi:hypothetical protein